MKRIAFLLVAVAIIASAAALMAPASGGAADDAVPIYGIKLPAGYRDWRLVSVAHEEGTLHSIGAVLGNDVAIKAYRAGPFRSRTAQSLLPCTTATSRQRKTTKSSVILNPSLPGLRQTFSSWSRIRKSSPRLADGDSPTSTKTANPAPKHY